MKMKKQTKASLFPLLIALAVVGIVFGIIFFQAQKTQQTQSKASYSVLTECRNLCANSLPENISLKQGACDLNCIRLKNGKMNCTEFCAAWGPAKDACEPMCNRIADPCTTNPEGVCATAGQYAQECIGACRVVRKGTKTCNEAFTNNPRWNSIKNQSQAYLNAFNAIVHSCRNAFE